MGGVKMEVVLRKNIKYKGLYFKAGDLIEVEGQHLEEFIEKEIIAGELSETEASNHDIEGDNDTINTVGIEEDEEYSNGNIKPYKIDELSKDEIIEILAANGIEHNKRDKKDILFKLLP